MRWLFVVLFVLLTVPRYDGAERLPLIAERPVVAARPYVPDGGWPRRIGALVPVGGVTLHSYDPAFGGFSALAIRDGRAMLLSDGGNALSFAMRNGRIEDARGHVLRDGPAHGWHRSDRDTESLAVDPATGITWVGFEGHNEIRRYEPGFASGAVRVRPAEMRDWPVNAGAESLVRLADGRFVAIAEQRPNRRTRAALLFSGDPTAKDVRIERFLIARPPGYNPSDAVQMPGGDLLVLARRFAFPFRFDAVLIRVPLSQVRAGVVARGRIIAHLEPPVVGENCEGLAVTVENGRTMLWITTDNDLMPLRPSYLLKFRLEE